MYKIVGLELKNIRNKKKLSLRELSKKMNYSKSKSMLQRYEEGKAGMTVDTLIEICNALDADYNLVMNTAKNAVAEDVKIYIPKNEVAEAYENAPPNIQKIIRQLLELDEE